jgi:hypothetical protein
MKRSLICSVVALAASAGVAHAAIPENAKYDGKCAYTLAAKGEELKTDCGVSWIDSVDKKTYCFASEEAKKDFSKDLIKHKKAADQAYAKLHTDGTHTETVGSEAAKEETL